MTEPNGETETMRFWRPVESNRDEQSPDVADGAAALPADVPVDAPVEDIADEVADVLAGGGCVVLPTDTVYGLAACPAVPGATDALFRLKGRGADVPIAVLVVDAITALSLAAPPAGEDEATTRDTLAEHWPGPLTMVLPRSPSVEWSLGLPAETIGVRVPDHALVRAVAARIGPIATTSANRHGVPTPATAADAAASLAGRVDLVVDGGRLAASASTVVAVDVAGHRTVLRQGPIVV